MINANDIVEWNLMHEIYSNYSIVFMKHCIQITVLYHYSIFPSWGEIRLWQQISKSKVTSSYKKVKQNKREYWTLCLSVHSLEEIAAISLAL